MLGNDHNKPQSLFCCDIAVCPTNCIPGIMGKGLALEFADRYHGLKEQHRRYTVAGWHRIGKPMMCSSNGWSNVVCLFPTKRHWRDHSQIDWIEDGLVWLQQHLQANVWPGASIGMPMLGCGLGGLDPRGVMPVLVRFAEQVQQPVYIYEGP